MIKDLGFKRYEPPLIDLNNKNDSHSLIIELIGKDKRVLEVGTSTGYVTKILKELNNVVMGVETDEDAAEVAKQYCESMIVGDVEELDLDRYIEPASIDVILLADVLEHLRWPCHILDKVKKYIKPNGYLVVSLPNVSHGDVLLNLLNGDFRYTPRGLLDETHLRFFGRRNIVDVFNSHGYDIKDICTTRVPIGATELKLDSNRIPLELLKFIRALPDSDVYQFVFKAVPSAIPSNESIPKVDFDKVFSFCAEDILKEHEVKEIELSMQLQQANAQVTALSHEIGNMKNMKESIVWLMTIRFYEGFINRVLPQGSRSRSCYDLGLKGCRILANNGWRGFRANLRAYIKNCKRFAPILEVTEEETNAIRQECIGLKYRPKISIIIPVWNTKEKWLRGAIDSVLDQIYDNWELCIVDDASTKPHIKKILNDYSKKNNRIKVKFLNKNLGRSDASNEALCLATGEFVGLLGHDDQLVTSALYEIVKLLNEKPETDFIYSDEIHIDERDIPGLAFYRPDFSLDYMLSHCYIMHFVSIRSNILRKIKGFRKEFDVSQEYDLFLRVLSETRRIAHIPKILYKWRLHKSSEDQILKPKVIELSKKAIQDFLNREGIEGQVLDGKCFNFFRIKRKIIGRPKITVIIPTKDQVNLLKRCIESIECRTSYKNYEVIVVDNLSLNADTKKYLEDLQTRYNNYKVIKFDESFNYSKLNNFAVKYATGEHILLLNNDVEVIASEWLEALLEHSQREEVGCVGAKLVYPNKRIQHAGVVVGLFGCAEHIYKFVDSSDIGYLGQLISIRNYSAVTAACMMVKKSIFEKLGGFDENIKVGFGDIDFCLRAVKEGYINVFTPYAELYHYESATRGKNLTTDPHPEDSLYFRKKWGKIIQEGDCYYNHNLPVNTLDITSYIRAYRMLSLCHARDMIYDCISRFA